MKSNLNTGRIYSFSLQHCLSFWQWKKMMYLRTPGTGKLIRAPNFFSINNRSFKAINTGAGHSKTVHLSSNSRPGYQALWSCSEKWVLSSPTIAEQLLLPKVLIRFPEHYMPQECRAHIKSAISLPCKFIMEPK